MNDTTSSGLRGSIVEEELTLTTVELCRACNASESHIELWVSEGVLQPTGASPDEWRFDGRSLTRMRASERPSNWAVRSPNSCKPWGWPAGGSS